MRCRLRVISTNTRFNPRAPPHAPYPIRSMATTATAPATAPATAASTDVVVRRRPSFSAGSDTESLTAALAPLLHASDGRWQLTPKGNGLERSFRFKTFKKTWEFMNAVAKECTIKKHHPEWSNVYNTTFIRWTTHSPPGLSIKDIEMARFCDEQAVVYGELEVVDRPQQGGPEVGRELADRVAVEGGDCCVPKSKR